MWFADFALKRPYTIIASLILVCLMGIGAGLRMPVDIFPEIDIPVVSVVWTYQGMSAPEMRDRINSMVKMREAFRPFAPAVSAEQAPLWFEIPPGTELPYMITTVPVRKQFRAQLPAITHVDGSARVQTVSALDNAEFHSLLQAVGRITGREMVLNTSFNVKGQPIVNTPREALETFLGTGIDYLFLENIIVRRPCAVPFDQRVFQETVRLP